MNALTANLSRVFASKTMILALAAGLWGCHVSQAAAQYYYPDKPTIIEMKQEGDKVVVKFLIPSRFDAYHITVRGPGQTGLQQEHRGHGIRTYTIANVGPGRGYYVSIQAVKKASEFLAKDDCSPWEQTSLTTHAIAQEIIFKNQTTGPVHVVVRYRLNGVWKNTSFKLEKGASSKATEVLTDNTNLYYYAEQHTTGLQWVGTHRIAGFNLGFRLYDTGSGWETRTVNLTKSK